MARETMKTSKVAAAWAGFIGGNFFILMLGYLVFCLTLGSVFLQFAPTNFWTGERYTIAQIVTTAGCSVFAC
jgi:uncharacterized membrane protein